MDKIKLLDLEKNVIENINFMQESLCFNRLKDVNYDYIDPWNREINNLLMKIEIDLSYAIAYNKSSYPLAEYKKCSHTLCVLYSLTSLKDKFSFLLLEILYKDTKDYYIIEFTESGTNSWEQLTLQKLNKNLEKISNPKYLNHIEKIQNIINDILNLYKKFQEFNVLRNKSAHSWGIGIDSLGSGIFIRKFYKNKNNNSNNLIKNDKIYDEETKKILDMFKNTQGGMKISLSENNITFIKLMNNLEKFIIEMNTIINCINMCL